MRLKHPDGWTTPADAPYYPPLPVQYRNVRMQFVFFRTDVAAVGALLPEPLEPTADGLCMACGLAAPFTSNYGPFDETFVVQKCTFQGRPGWYCSHVLHNGPAAIAAGREIYGTPKVHADVKVEHADRIMVSRAHIAGLPVMTVASTMATSCPQAELPSLAPCWRLKLIPRADGPGPALKQLIDGAAAVQDSRTHVSLKGHGTVRFEPHPLCDLTALQPLEYVGAFYLETDYVEGYANVAHDYLKSG